MDIFVSWSGEPSRELAGAVRDWLQAVLQYTRPWLSDQDIESGKRWSLEIGKVLERTNFGILCLTQANSQAPWVLFEAGALSKSVEEGRLVPVLFDMGLKDLTGPLSQFQAIQFDKSTVKDLLTSINSVAPETVRVTPNVLDRSFDMAWPDLRKRVDEILSRHKSAQVGKLRKRPDGEILEELVGAIRALDHRFTALEELTRLPSRRTDLARATLSNNETRRARGALSSSKGEANARHRELMHAAGEPPLSYTEFMRREVARDLDEVIRELDSSKDLQAPLVRMQADLLGSRPLSAELMTELVGLERKLDAVGHPVAAARVRALLASAMKL